MDRKILAKYLDLANHRQEATPSDIKKLCLNVEKYGFNSAFVNQCFLPLAKKILKEKKVGTVISFPLGQDSRDAKIVAALDAVKKGADELDISMNVGLFKAREDRQVLEEMETIVEVVKDLRKSVLVKFIIETGQLSPSEIKRASLLVLRSGADFIKTCSGFGPRGATLEDVRLIREAVGDKIKIKVAGGIDTLKEAEDFISAGANRIGTSRAVEIMKEWENQRFE